MFQPLLSWLRIVRFYLVRVSPYGYAQVSFYGTCVLIIDSPIAARPTPLNPSGLDYILVRVYGPKIDERDLIKRLRKA